MSSSTWFPILKCMHSTNIQFSDDMTVYEEVDEHNNNNSSTLSKFKVLTEQKTIHMVKISMDKPDPKIGIGNLTDVKNKNIIYP